MGNLKYEELTSDERERVLQQMVELLRGGISRKLRLSTELNVTVKTVKCLRKQLTDERKDNRRRY